MIGKLLVYDLTGTLDGTTLCPYLTQGQVRKLVSTVSGLDHLEGQKVVIVQDGELSSDSGQSVSGGSISLSAPAAVIHAGLPYSGKVQFLPLGGDGQSVNESKERKVYDIVLRVWKSLSGQFGKDVNSLFGIGYQESVNQNTEDDIYFTGDIHFTPFESSWDGYWSPVFIQEDPLPFMMLAAIIRSEISEDK